MIDELTLKMMNAEAGIGPELTDDEKKEIREREFKYQLIRVLYFEKMKSLGVDLKDFHFTPGEKWMETPVYDIVHSLVEIHEKTVSGEYKPMTPEEMAGW